MRRSGLRIRGSRGHPEVCGALIRFARWLRTQYEFPVRVPVYLSPLEVLTTVDGNATATFYPPFDPKGEPYIQIATGDYDKERRERGRDNALAGYLVSLAHEVVHYDQWIRTGRGWERGVVRRACALVDAYALTVDHP